MAVVLNIGSTTRPSRIMSVDRASPTTMKAGASITCNLASANIIIFGSGGNVAASYYGMNFIATLASGNPIMSLSFLSTTYHRFENCSFQCGAGTNVNGDHLRRHANVGRVGRRSHQLQLSALSPRRRGFRSAAGRSPGGTRRIRASPARFPIR